MTTHYTWYILTHTLTELQNALLLWERFHFSQKYVYRIYPLSTYILIDGVCERVQYIQWLVTSKPFAGMCLM